MYIISSVHLIILAIQQMSHDLKRVSETFDHAHPIFISYCELVSPSKKSIYSIDFFMRYSQFKRLFTRETRSTFNHSHPNIFNFLIFKLLISCINMQKSRLIFHHFVLEIYLIYRFWNLIDIECFDPIWLRNKLINLLLLLSAKKMKEKYLRWKRKTKNIYSIILKSNYSYMLPE